MAGDRSDQGFWCMLSITLVAALLLTACAPAEDRSEARPEQSPRAGGTLVFGAEQEPTNGLNGMLACCAHLWAGIIMDAVLEGAYEYTPDFTYEPVLIEEAIVEDNPLAVTYRIRAEAEWSDGTPVTAQDFEFTYDTFMDPDVDIVSRTGFDQISKVDVINDKTIRFEFSAPYAGWRELFVVVFPKHALEGEDFNKVWTRSIENPKTGEPIGSGPFLIESWDKGEKLTMVKNENWWGPRPPYLDEIVFRFMANTNTEIQQMRGGEVDVIYPQPQFALEALAAEPSIEMQTTGGFLWEFLSFNVQRPLLDNPNIRAAVAHAIDREAATEHLFRDIAPGTPVQNSGIYIPNQPEYEPNFDIWQHDPEKARELLEGEGCRPGADGFYVCAGERVSFEVLSTSGNDLREVMFEVLQEQAKKSGIELTSAFREPGIAIGPRGWAGGNFDLFMAAFGGVTDPFLFNDLYGCEGTLNFTGFCDQKVTRLLQASNTITDPAQRAATLNEADALLAEQLPILPLFQKPMFVAHSERVRGIVINPGANLPWNIEDWWLEN